MDGEKWPLKNRVGSSSTIAKSERAASSHLPKNTTITPRKKAGFFHRNEKQNFASVQNVEKKCLDLSSLEQKVETCFPWIAKHWIQVFWWNYVFHIICGKLFSINSRIQLPLIVLKITEEKMNSWKVHFLQTLFFHRICWKSRLQLFNGICGKYGKFQNKSLPWPCY